MWKSGSHDPRKFCQPGLIILPLNWGDPIPDLVTLDDAKILFKLPNGTITGGEESKVNSTHCLLKSAGLSIFASSTPFTPSPIIQMGNDVLFPGGCDFI